MILRPMAEFKVDLLCFWHDDEFHSLMDSEEREPTNGPKPTRARKAKAAAGGEEEEEEEEGEDEDEDDQEDDDE